MGVIDCIILFLILGYNVDLRVRTSRMGSTYYDADFNVKMNYKCGLSVPISAREENMMKLLLKNKVSPTVPRDWDTMAR
jgi:hypothetical protein